MLLIYERIDSICHEKQIEEKKRHRKQLNRCLFRQSWNMNILFQGTAAFLSKLNIVLRLFSGTRYKIVSFAASIHDKLTANYRVCNPAFVKAHVKSRNSFLQFEVFYLLQNLPVLRKKKSFLECLIISTVLITGCFL